MSFVPILKKGQKRPHLFVVDVYNEPDVEYLTPVIKPPLDWDTYFTDFDTLSREAQQSLLKIISDTYKEAVEHFGYTIDDFRKVKHQKKKRNRKTITLKEKEKENIISVFSEDSQQDNNSELKEDILQTKQIVQYKNLIDQTTTTKKYA